MTSRLDEVAWPVRTERLSLRPADTTDLDAVWELRHDEEVERWITSAPKTIEEYRKQFEDPERLGKTIVVELDGVIVGDLMLAIEDAWAQAEVAEQAKGVQAEIGWCLGRRHQGHGYAREAVGALLRICFQDLGLRRVVANCFADNERSWRLMERLGMRRELHTVRESLHRSGEWLDGLGYAILAEEWRDRLAVDSPGYSDARARLHAERRETEQRLVGLTGSFEDIVNASESANADDEHDPEGATIAFERSQVGALIAQARAHLAELDAAEARVAEGTYGACESCGDPIAPERLEVLPVARECIRCAGRRTTHRR